MSKMLKNDQKNSIFTCINHGNLHSELRFHNAPSDFHHSSSCFSSHLAFITKAKYQVLIVVNWRYVSVDTSCIVRGRIPRPQCPKVPDGRIV